MKNLADLLERFKKSIGKDVLDKNIVIQTIKEITKIVLEPEEISIKENVLIIHSSQTKKNEIKLKEERILMEIQMVTKRNINKIFYQ